MAEITLFHGIRYAASIDLDAVVAPPYDVLSARQAAELRARSPLNVVHADLPVAPGESPIFEAYAAAGAAFHGWLADGTLVRDDVPALYVVDQAYRGPDGRERLRRGFVGRLTLADLDASAVLPHEKTHAGPKVDRLELSRAARADLSQIFLLYPDDDGAVGTALAPAADAASTDVREARDGDGNLHRVTPLRGGPAARVAELLRDKKLYIADGHHRYETALAYRDERRAAGDHSADGKMVYLCGMRDPGLTVFPTHRLVKDVDMPSMDDVLDRLATAFVVAPPRPVGRHDCEAMMRRLPELAGGSTAIGLYFAREDAGCTVTLRDRSATAYLQDEGFSPEAAGLAVTVLHYLILRDALGLDPARTEGRIDYSKDPGDAFDRLADGRYALGAFVNATLVDEVRAIADHGETMPQKSTYFYPKLLTGLVFDAPDGA